MALHLTQSGDIRFYRAVDGDWESTGFVTNSSWVSGGIVTPCIAFRDPGEYSIRISRFQRGLPDDLPPIEATKEEIKWKAMSWSSNEGLEVAEMTSDDED